MQICCRFFERSSRIVLCALCLSVLVDSPVSVVACRDQREDFDPLPFTQILQRNHASIRELDGVAVAVRFDTGFDEFFHPPRGGDPDPSAFVPECLSISGIDQSVIDPGELRREVSVRHSPTEPRICLSECSWNIH